jgi:hypothetical protein
MPDEKCVVNDRAGEFPVPRHTLCAKYVFCQKVICKKITCKSMRRVS